MENERMRENRNANVNVNVNANARTKITTRESGDEQRATELMNTDNQVRTNNEGKKRKGIGKPKTATNNAPRERECKKRKGKKSKKLEQPERGSDRTKQKPGSCISPGHNKRSEGGREGGGRNMSTPAVL